ncbi:MAG: undecaprenyl-phosphate glucose phosphotransferase [Steroidobacteraceae bacterium]
MAQRAPPVTFRKAARIPVGRDQLLDTIELLVDPLALTISLWALTVLFEGYLAPRYVILSLIVFSLTFPGATHLNGSLWRLLRMVVLSWLVMGGLMFVFAYASGYIRYFNLELLMTWFWVAPSSQIGAHLLLRLVAPHILNLQGERRRAIVAGMNAQGIELARRLGADPYSRFRVMGFFDDRATSRVIDSHEFSMLGRIADLPAYARDNKVDHIYISLPMASQPRILTLLDELRDTTASIYFVPDIFVTDLIQGRMDSVSGLPVVAVCETPFTGLNGLVKRGSDIVLSLLILVLTLPLLLVIALAVKLSSPGPVIFRQRRYGLDGREIIVYKFRSMTVTEDGATIRQASKDDARVTPVGRFLRKTSLDEFPQFFNVLQGRMSIVGPRPHAVAHNEMYRKLIKGYMLRHKVKPGITGWAQVNGFRGETEALEKMSGRIEYDLDYLRNWSLRLDLYIIAKTAWVIFMQKEAY